MKKQTLELAFLFLLQLLLLSHFSSAQFLPASPPIADPADARFDAVKEDWTSPALTNSNLKAVPPLAAYLNDYPGYTVELLQAQWRFGDPIDLYVMKPKGIKKPPVILYLYGYPAGTDRFKNEDFQKTVTKDGFAAHQAMPHYHRWKQAVGDWMAQPRQGVKHNSVFFGES